MSEIMKKSLKEKWGKIIKIFLENGFYHQGTLLESDDVYIVIDDRKEGKTLIKIKDVKTIKFEDDK